MARVIVVDDQPEIRRLLRILLEGEGFEVDEAADGTEALAMKMGRNDIVLLDVMMPGIDGWTVLAHLRTKGEDCPRVIMLTAMVAERDRQNALHRGAVRYLTKPFDPDEVVREVVKVMVQSDDALETQREHDRYMSKLLSMLERVAPKGGQRAS